MIIDMRVRPPFGSFLNDPRLNGDTFLEAMTGMFKYRPEPSQRDHRMESLIAEMDECGVTASLIPVRKPCGGDNASIAPLMKAWPGRFIAMAGVNLGDSPDISLETVDSCVLHGDFRGVAIEPQLEPGTGRMDHQNALPLYEKLNAERIPLMVTFGAYGHACLADINPDIVDKVALRFPHMPIIIGHAGWPNVTQMCWVAFKRPNVYLSPDYMAGYAGGTEYLRAACTMLENKIMFGSAYPILSQQHALSMYRSLAGELGMPASVLEKVLGGNAARLFGLS